LFATYTDGLEVLHLKNLAVNRILRWPAPFTKKSKIPDELNPSGFEDWKQRGGSIRASAHPKQEAAAEAAAS